MVEYEFEHIQKIMEDKNEVYSDIDKYLSRHLKEGIYYSEVVKELEKIIKNHDLNLAFPVNISVNNIAAHDTVQENDNRVFKKGDVIKIDIGVHYNGYIIDSAKTYILGNKIGDKIKKVSEKIIKEISKDIQEGIMIKDISAKIEEISLSEGFGLVSNLTGHTLERYNVHGGISIPNVKNDITYKIKKGDMIAIEPFVASSSSHILIKDHPRTEIYELIKKGNSRNKYARILLKEINSKFGNGLPFAKSWLNSLKGTLKEMSLKQLVKEGFLYEYPVLYTPNEEILIAQSEVTFYIGDEIKVFGFEF